MSRGLYGYGTSTGARRKRNRKNMENIIEMMAARRSCRKYTSEPLTAEEIKDLKRAALMSPTSKNCHSWEYVFVEDKEVIEKLSKSKEHGASFVSGATLAIVIFGNTSKTDVWVEDAAIASAMLMIEAHSMGLGTCYVQLKGRGYSDGRTAKDIVKELLNVPEGVEPLCILAVGRPDESHRPYTDDRLEWGHIHDERF